MNKIEFTKDKIPFTQVANGVLHDTNLSLKAKGLYAYLYSKPNGWDFAATRISEETKDSEKTIRGILNELIKAGYVSRLKLPSGRVLYQVHFPPASQTVERDVRVEKPNGRKGNQSKGQPAVSTAISNKEFNKERERVIKKGDLDVLPIKAELWEEWETYRKQIGKRLNPTTRKRQLTFLSGQDNPEACLEQSMLNGWTGLFAIKDTPATGKSVGVIRRN